jgi:hypothetical protein
VLVSNRTEVRGGLRFGKTYERFLEEILLEGADEAVARCREAARIASKDPYCFAPEWAAC